MYNNAVSAIEQSVLGFIKSDILHRSSTASLDTERDLLEEGILDSLGLQKLVTFLEKEFSVAIDDDYLLPENFATIGAIASFVSRMRG